jgi:branched-chain amino acid transport system permease protein
MSFWQVLMGGLTLGVVYALAALGFSLIYSASGLMTFVQGDFLMLGAFIAYTLYVILNIPFVIIVAITLGVMFVVGLLTEKTLIRPLLKRGSGAIHIVLATIGLSYFLQNFAMLAWGTDVKEFPSVFGDQPFQVGHVTLVPEKLWVVGIAFVCMFILHIFMTRTKLGTAMRAASQDKMAAGVLGINVNRTQGLTWAIAAVMAAIGGVLLAPVYAVYATMGVRISLKGFAAAVVGGYGNLYGAMIGGVLFGLVETFSSAYIGSASKDIITFAALLIVLFCAPTGILKSAVIEET